MTLGYNPAADLSQPIALVLDDRSLGPVTIGWITPAHLADPRATTIPLTYETDPLPGHQSLHQPAETAVLKAGYEGTEGADGSVDASLNDENPLSASGWNTSPGPSGRPIQIAMTTPGARKPDPEADEEYKVRRQLHEETPEEDLKHGHGIEILPQPIVRLAPIGNPLPIAPQPDTKEPKGQAVRRVPPVQLAATKIPSDHEPGLEGPDYSGAGGGIGGVLEGPLGPPSAPGLTGNPGEIVKPVSRPPSGGSPSLRGDPYHPDSVASRLQRPIYESNPPHGEQLRPGKTPEPSDAAAAFESGAVRGKNLHTWYAKGKNGRIYRYQESNDGKIHFNAIVKPKEVPRVTFPN